MQKQLDIDFQIEDRTFLAPSQASPQKSFLDCYFVLVRMEYMVQFSTRREKKNGWKEHWMAHLVTALFLLNRDCAPPFCCSRPTQYGVFDLLIKSQQCLAVWMLEFRVFIPPLFWSLKWFPIFFYFARVIIFFRTNFKGFFSWFEYDGWV